MPSLRCKCGEILDLGSIPAPDGYQIISEARFEEIRSESPLEKLGFYFDLASFESYKCHKCGRLIVYWEKGNPIFYKPE